MKMGTNAMNGTFRTVQKGKIRYYDIPGMGLLPSVTSVMSIISKPSLNSWMRSTEMESAFAMLRLKLESKPLETPLEAYMEESFSEAAEFASKAPERHAAVSSDYGTKAHEILQELCSGREVHVPSDQKIVEEAFEKFMRNEGRRLKIFCTEKAVFSEKYRFAGSVDAIAMICDENGDPDPSKVVVIDWKTSKQVYSEYGMQVAAYAKAYEEMTGTQVTHGWVVRFSKEKADYSIRQIACLDRAFECFRACATIFHNNNMSLFHPAKSPISFE